MRLMQTIKNKIRGITPIEELIECGMVVGENFWCGNGCKFDWSFPWLIKIGDNVTLSHDVDIITHDASLHRRLNVTKLAKVEIGNNVFVGARVTILPGVKLGDNSIIGAGSLVCKDVPADEVWAGVPAQKICTVQDYVRRTENDIIEEIIDASKTIHNSDAEYLPLRQQLIEMIDKNGKVYIK